MTEITSRPVVLNTPAGRQKFARAMAWVLSVGATILGIIFMAVRNVSVEVPVQGQPDTFLMGEVSIGWIGAVLFGAGFLTLMALLIITGFFKGGPVE